MFYGAVKLQPLPTNLFCRNKFCHRWENSFALRSDKNLNAYPSIFCQLKSTFSELLKIIINSKQQVKQIHTLENQKVPRRVCWNTLSLPPKGPTAILSLLHVLEIFKQSPATRIQLLQRWFFTESQSLWLDPTHLHRC